MASGAFGTKRLLRFGWIISKYRQKQGQKHTSIQEIRKLTRLSYRDSRTHHFLISSDISAKNPIQICLNQMKQNGEHLNKKNHIVVHHKGNTLWCATFLFYRNFGIQESELLRKQRYLIIYFHHQTFLNFHSLFSLKKTIFVA